MRHTTRDQCTLVIRIVGSITALPPDEAILASSILASLTLALAWAIALAA